MIEDEGINVKRRHFLQLLLAGGLVMRPGVTIAQTSEVERRILGLARRLSRNASIQKMGNLYIKESPAKAKSADYVQYIENRILQVSDNKLTGLEGMLNSAIREDYLNEKITEINGWRFSRTEACMYALCALTG